MDKGATNAAVASRRGDRVSGMRSISATGWIPKEIGTDLQQAEATDDEVRDRYGAPGAGERSGRTDREPNVAFGRAKK